MNGGPLYQMPVFNTKRAMTIFNDLKPEISSDYGGMRPVELDQPSALQQATTPAQHVRSREPLVVGLKQLDQMTPEHMLWSMGPYDTSKPQPGNIDSGTRRWVSPSLPIVPVDTSSFNS